MEVIKKTPVNIPIIKNSKDNVKLLNLYYEINELREVLNEICCDTYDSRTNSKRLNVSQCLDELIVEYMKELNNKNQEDINK